MPHGGDSLLRADWAVTIDLRPEAPLGAATGRPDDRADW